MTKFTIQQFKPFLCEQVFFSEVILITDVDLNFLFDKVQHSFQRHDQQF